VGFFCLAVVWESLLCVMASNYAATHMNPLSPQTGSHNKKGQGSKRTLTLSDASSSMGNGMTANRQSGMSVSMVLEHLRVSYTEGNDSVRKILLQIF